MTDNQRREILIETVKRFGKQEWFRDAVVHDSYPTSGEPTLEIKVNYVPLFERKAVKEFALSVGGLVDRYTIVDKDGKPVE
jgi:hypothetical protein